MDYELYSKNFWQMQKDYFALDDLMTKMRTLKVEAYLTDGGQVSQYDTYAKEYTETKARVFANVNRLKEFFVENNEDFDYINFKNSLSFYNGYSIMEEIHLLSKSDYKKLNATFLNQYKEEIAMILITKKGQYDALNTSMEGDKKQYIEEFKEDIRNSNITASKPQAMRAKYEKTLIQRENVYKKLHFVEKEAKIIDEVLEQFEIKTL